MKTNSINAMKNLFKTFLLGLTLMVSVNAYAAMGQAGNMMWRNSIFDLKISQSDLSGQIVYAKVSKQWEIDTLFGKPDSMCTIDPMDSGKKRLFDVMPSASFDECKNYIKDKYYYLYTPVGKKWNENYYAFIAPKDAYEAGAIIKIQMGNVETREPPKVLKVIKKNEDEWDDSCNANGEYHGVTCEGWSYKSIMHLWGKTN